MDYQQLVGSTLGPGPEIVVYRDRVDSYFQAIGSEVGFGVPLFFVVALIPALGAGLEPDLPTLRATINYGLNRVEQIAEVRIGARLSATFTVSAIDPVGSGLQIVRSVEVVADASQLVVVAETVSRLVY